LGKLIDLSDFKAGKDRLETGFKNIANNFKKQREQIKTLVRKDEFLKSLNCNQTSKEPLSHLTVNKERKDLTYACWKSSQHD